MRRKVCKQCGKEPSNQYAYAIHRCWLFECWCLDYCSPSCSRDAEFIDMMNKLGDENE